MTTWQIVALSALEAVALFLAVRLWSRKTKLSIKARLVWSVVLLVPLIGLSAYMACFTNPGEELFDTYTAGELRKIVEEGTGSHHD